MGSTWRRQIIVQVIIPVLCVVIEQSKAFMGTHLGETEQYRVKGRWDSFWRSDVGVQQSAVHAGCG